LSPESFIRPGQRILLRFRSYPNADWISA